MKIRLLVLAIVTSWILARCAGSSSEFGLLERAEQLSRAGKYDQAIQAYRDHMQYRLGVKKRPEWENPYFYLILIGDIELGQGKVSDAEKAYQEAEEHKVDPYLVADRYRGLAHWYESRANLADAIKVLERYRSRDPLLFESMLDRLAKQLTAEEDAARAAKK